MPWLPSTGRGKCLPLALYNYHQHLTQYTFLTEHKVFFFFVISVCCGYFAVFLGKQIVCEKLVYLNGILTIFSIFYGLFLSHCFVANLVLLKIAHFLGETFST